MEDTLEEQIRDTDTGTTGGGGETRRSGGDEGHRGGPRDRERGRGNRFSRRAKVCPFCDDKNNIIDYKRVDMLQRFLTDRGTIRSRRKVGTCAKHQRRLAVAIKRARHLALLPYTSEHIRGA
jgi:small subunit ribosomal protein S18